MKRLMIVVPCYNEQEIFESTLTELSNLLFELIQKEKIAKNSGIKTLAVTTFSESKISIIADYVLLTKTRESPLHKIAISSRISQFAVMDSLLMACMVTDYSDSISHIDLLSKKIKEI